MENYGPVENGLSGGSEYLTPYQTTIFYNPASTFETAVAFLSDRAQLIPIDPLVDPVGAYEHPSPNVVIFGTDFSNETLIELFDKQFQHIHVFIPTGTVSKYADDPRVTTFTIDEIYDHVELISGMVSSFILEHIILATHPGFKGMFSAEVTSETGKHFLRALTDDSVESGVHLGVSLLNLCKSGYRGFDNVKSMVIAGQSTQKIYDRIAAKCVSEGIFYKLAEPEMTVYAISGNIATSEMLKLLPEQKQLSGTDFAIIYNLEVHAIDGCNYPGWRVTAVKIGQSSAVDFLKCYSPQAVGDDTTATAWIPTGAAKSILTFIYPS